MPLARGARIVARALGCAVALSSVLDAGCGTTSHAVVTRRIDGRSVAGGFVSPFAYEMYVRGELALAQGDARGAAAAFEAALTGPSADAFLYARLADARARAGDAAGAERALGDADRLDACSEAAWSVRARLYAERHDTRAISAAERAHECAPDDVEPLLALAEMLERHGHRARTLELLRSFAARDDLAAGRAARARFELALRGEDAEVTLEAFAQLAATAPTTASDVERLVTQVAADARRDALASTWIDRLDARRLPVRQRVQLLLWAGSTTRAEAVIATSDLDELGGARELADTLVAAGRADTARVLLEALPEDVLERTRALAHVYAAQDDVLGLAELWARAPADAVLAATLTRALVARAEPGLALAVASGAQWQASDGPLVTELIAEAHLSRGDRDAALRAADSGTLDKVALARLFERAGRFDEAVATYRSVPPTDGAPARVRVEHLVASGDVDRAREVLREAVRHAPGDALLHARLAELAARAGAMDEARHEARLAGALTGDSPVRARLATLLAR